MTSNPKAEIIKDALRRFPHFQKRALARYILDTNGMLWDNDLEAIRKQIRYYTGASGDRDRVKVASRIIPTQAPVEMPQTWRKIRSPYHLPAGTWFAVFDVHVPFHEPKPIEAAVQYAKDRGVDGVLLGGDLADTGAVAFWPTAKRDFNAEMESVTDFLDWLRQQFPDGRIIWKPGNHEYRYPRMFINKAPELAQSPIAAMETVLALEDRGIEFLDYYQVVMAGELPIIHGHEYPSISRAVNPARGLFNRTNMFAMCGHLHSTSEHTSKSLVGTMLTTWSVGCLCDLSPDYNPYGNWNWGFAIVHVERGGHFEVENRRILPNGRVV